MSSLFDDLKEGLEEAIAYEKGTGKAPDELFYYAENIRTQARALMRMSFLLLSAVTGINLAPNNTDSQHCRNC